MSAAEAKPRDRSRIAGLLVASLALVITGGIILGSFLPRRPPMVPAWALLGVSLVALGTAISMLARLRPFAWRRFFTVARWALLGFVVEAGMLEYVFVSDGVRGEMLVVLSAMLAVFAVDIPVILAFGVARYADQDA
jgi:hypothetical protein